MKYQATDQAGKQFVHIRLGFPNLKIVIISFAANFRLNIYEYFL